MKKLIIMAAVALAMAGCGKKDNSAEEVDKTGICQFHTVEVDRKCELQFPDSLKDLAGNGKIYTHISANICWPDSLSGNAPKELQDSLLSMAFGTYRAASLDSSLSNLTSSPLGFEDMKGVKQKTVKTIPAESETVQQYTYNLSATPSYIGTHLITYSISMSSYLGGAHGYYTTTYLNYDIDKEQVLTVGRMIADVDGLKAAIMREVQQNPDYAGGLLVDKIPTVDNFYVDGALINFVYNPYEVACYAAGTVTASLPIHEVRDYMTDYGKKLFPEEQ